MVATQVGDTVAVDMLLIQTCLAVELKLRLTVIVVPSELFGQVTLDNSRQH
jgi:hypothetical protein